MILTIGMIVKNEEKYLEQCLTAIKPILENVDCELIIADTGSTDRTVEIARKFTDNVFYFEWIKDFAAARNSTLEKAKGEWYMYLDADEIFKSCGEIIYFFNSGEYKKYNSASYIIRNYSSENEANCSYGDFSAVRLSKIKSETAFIGKVHEALNTAGKPYKCLGDIADHYGYAYGDNKKSSEEKFKRNSELLLESFEEEKDTNQMIYLQLAECFVGHDNARAYEYLEMGIEACKKLNSLVLIPIYAEKAYIEYQDEKYDEVIETCRDYFSMSEKIRPCPCGTDPEMLGLRASSYYKLKRYTEAIPAYMEYFSVFKDFSAGKLNTFDVFLQTYKVSVDSNFIPILCEFIACCINTGRYNTAADYLKSLPINKYSFNRQHISVLVHQEIRIIEHFGFGDISGYAKQLDDCGKNLIKNNLSLVLFSREDKNGVLAALSSISDDDPTFTGAIEIFKRYFIDGIADIDMISAFTEKYSLNDFPEMLYIAIRSRQDISRLLVRDNYDIKVCVKLCYSCFRDFQELLENYPPECIGSADGISAAAKLYIYSMQNALITFEYNGKENHKSIEKLFEAYGILGDRYCRLKEISNKSQLPEDIGACALSSEIVEYRRSRRYKECISAMKELVNGYPALAAVIEDYRKLVISEYESNRPKTELEKLAEAVKSNIRSYISMGNMAAALHTLNEYKKINPSDPEIAEISKLIK